MYRVRSEKRLGRARNMGVLLLPGLRTLELECLECGSSWFYAICRQPRIMWFGKTSR